MADAKTYSNRQKVSVSKILNKWNLGKFYKESNTNAFFALFWHNSCQKSGANIRIFLDTEAFLR